jgi:hypothetical protein
LSGEFLEQRIAHIERDHRAVEITEHADHRARGTGSLNLTDTSFETPSSSIVTP